jgi:hypothetical protein
VRCNPRAVQIHKAVCLFFQICILQRFLDTCPASNSASATIKNDFVVRKDGAVASEPSGSDPVSQMPIDQVSEELIACP